MLGQIIVYDQYIFSLIHEILCQCGSGVRCHILKRCRIGCGGNHNGCVFHGIMCFQSMNNLGYGRSFLTDCHINTFYIFALLVQNGINRNRSLTCLTVTDDQFSLSTSDWEHGVNGKNTCLHWYRYRFTIHNTRCFIFDRAVISGWDLSFSVNRRTQGIDNTAKELISYRDAGFLSGSHYFAAFTNLAVTSEQDTADLVTLDILYHTLDTVIKDYNFTVHGMVDTINVYDTVSNGLDNTDFFIFCCQVEIFNFTL